MSPLRRANHPFCHQSLERQDNGSDHRCGLQFLAVQPPGTNPDTLDWSSLRPRMEKTARTRATPVRPLTTNGLLRRAGNYSLRAYLATRRLRWMAADRPHDSTSTVDDGRAPANTLRRALSTT